jgi:hypothetical protein
LARGDGVRSDAMKVRIGAIAFMATHALPVSIGYAKAPQAAAKQFRSLRRCQRGASITMPWRHANTAHALRPL